MTIIQNRNKDRFEADSFAVFGSSLLWPKPNRPQKAKGSRVPANSDTLIDSSVAVYTLSFS